ncbi:hypothetical protein QJQ45_017136, partial [Haematococcus lacustris]
MESMKVQSQGPSAAGKFWNTAKLSHSDLLMRVIKADVELGRSCQASWSARFQLAARELMGGEFTLSPDIVLGTKAMEVKWLERTGTLYNQKHAVRFGLSDSTNCPLCGQPDSALHILSGCTATNKLVTHRHNAAGRAILRAVQDGALGAGLVFTDVGDLYEDSDTASPIKSKLKRRNLRRALDIDPTTTGRITYPDAVIISPNGPYEGPATKIPLRHRHVTLIEIKYCMDTDPTEQLHKATAQHANLLQALQPGINCASAKQINIMLG